MFFLLQHTTIFTFIPFSSSGAAENKRSVMPDFVGFWSLIEAGDISPGILHIFANWEKYRNMKMIIQHKTSRLQTGRTLSPFPRLEICPMIKIWLWNSLSQQYQWQYCFFNCLFPIQSYLFCLWCLSIPFYHPGYSGDERTQMLYHLPGEREARGLCCTGLFLVN